MKTFKQFTSEQNINMGKEVADVEKNFIYSQGRPGHKAPGYRYAGRRAPDINDKNKEVPEQVRVAQDLKAERQRSQQRQAQDLKAAQQRSQQRQAQDLEAARQRSQQRRRM